MIKRLVIGLLVAAVLGLGLFWFLTIPQKLDADTLAKLRVEGDPARGEVVFNASGCASCHAKKDAKGEEKLLLGGEHALNTPVGVFQVPNISPDPENGIGSWNMEEFANAVLKGVSPDGRHYYPAFPYASYAGMDTEDVIHLWAYLQSLPPVSTPNKPHSLSFPFNVSRGTGLWKLVFANADHVVEVADEPTLKRGRYLVEVLGHCGECHAPRTAFGFGGTDTTRWLAGGPAPEGDGKIPNITPHADGLESWSTTDIAYYLESGFTPDFDSVGGSMASVQQNMAKLPKKDRQAIAAYLKAIPAVASK